MGVFGTKLKINWNFGKCNVFKRSFSSFWAFIGFEVNTKHAGNLALKMFHTFNCETLLSDEVFLYENLDQKKLKFLKRFLVLSKKACFQVFLENSIVFKIQEISCSSTWLNQSIFRSVFSHCCVVQAYEAIL